MLYIFSFFERLTFRKMFTFVLGPISQHVIPITQPMEKENLFGPIGESLTLSQRIERKIEEAIREKRLPVGSKLPSERELCEMFAVSRTALREALRRLSARGLVDIRKGSGVYVSDYNIKDAISSLLLYYDLKFDQDLVLQINQARAMFEPEIARLAARNRTDEHLKGLRQAIDDLIDCDPDNTQREADLVNRFHAKVTEASGNSFVIISMEPIFSLVPRIRNFIYANIEGEKMNIVRDHERIYKAILNQDGDTAYGVMKALIERTNRIYLEHLHKYNVEEGIAGSTS